MSLAKGKEISGRIIFSSSASGKWDLWIVDPKSGSINPLTDTDQYENSPSVSPNGSEIAYVDERRRLWVMQANGSNRHEIPIPKGIYAQPSWSPNGNEIAFVRYEVIPEDQSEIWVIRRREGNWVDLERITDFPPMRLYPSYSPDGSQMAYTEFRRDKLLGAVEEIGIMDLTSRKLKLITDDAADSFGPVWSPAGDWIAYTSNKSGNYDIWIMSVKDRKHHQLTRDTAYDGEPAWAPDGNELAFVSTRTGSREIWLVSMTGDHERQLTRMGNGCKDPFWVK